MTDTPPPPRRAHWTPAKQRIFLVAFHDSGCVAIAAQAAGMSRSSAHRLRARLAGTPFARTWDSVLADYRRRLADPFAAPPAGPAPSRPAAASSAHAAR
jgi:AraC-like DNA-binding protein